MNTYPYGYDQAMDVPGLIRRARSGAALTQAALAERANTSQAAVSFYESGRKVPSIDTLERLLAVCGDQLGVVPGTRVARPTAAQLERAGVGLVEVLELAALLPTRHAPDLRYPRLPIGPTGPAATTTPIG